MLSESSDDGKVTTWKYLPKTDFVISKLVQDEKRILLREFAFFDDCNNLIKKLVDDGSGVDPYDLTDVSERRITEYRRFVE